ncbi:MAG: gamma-glutamyltransferase family protein [Sneathiella sp.]|uniref:gamma-glutamyltransferase family protein n=1 Tax=Sneathiella sp. TaxID=1964365 RepID=UPI0030032146
MLQTKRAYGGMVTAPHHLASRAGIRVLEEGGNAIEAMIAAAAMITVAYPHMNAMGGDNFWLIHTPGKSVQGIDACGGAAAKADIAYYENQGFNTIPSRGSQAALTVAGAVSGWQEAYNFSQNNWGGTLPMDRLLEDAIHYAEQGISVSQTLANNAKAKFDELQNSSGFKNTYFIDGALPKIGARFCQPRIAETLRHLAKSGLDDFYHGDTARKIAADLERVGSPLRLEDLERHRALSITPLSVDVAGHKVFNMPPPTQGLASLLLLGVYERLQIPEAETFEYIHGLVESTKRAFRIRDQHVTDPDYMKIRSTELLTASHLQNMASDIDMGKALPWPDASAKGDTVWLGAVDNQGRAVSFIQSIFWEFGSGVVLDETGITWQNRGTSFSLDQNHHNSLKPLRRPFHTIQPALAQLKDGRVMPFGTMGGEGQPQTQAMVFSRHVLYGQDLQKAISAPRWLLGRTWGAETSNLRIENRIAPNVIQQLKEAGHDLEVIGAYDEVMGHAGALVHHPDGLIEGAADPRSDGSALGF